MRRVPVFRVAGEAVSAATGQPASNSSINLIAKGQQGGGTLSIQAAVRDGSFEFDGVPSGVYLLQASPDGMSGDAILVGRQEVTANRSDVEDVLLPITPAAEMAGRVTVEGIPAGPLTKMRITLNSTEGISYGFAAGQVAYDGSFVIPRRRADVLSRSVNVASLQPSMYVKSIRLGGRDVTGASIDLSGDSAGLLDIVLSTNGGAVSGTVHDSSGGPLPSACIVLWNATADQPEPQVQALFPMNDDGRFSYGSLKPGDYKVLGLASVQLNLGDVYDWIAKFGDRAVPVRIEEGSHQVVDLPAINPS
jgi:hypothetical protein